MRRLFIAVFAILLVSFAFALVAGELPSKYLSKNHQDIIPTLNSDRVIPENAVRWSDVNRFSELDDIIGDTLVVGTTWWESQHNGTVGRMIGLEPGRPELGPTVHMVWTDLESQGGNRHVKYSRGYDLAGIMVYESTPWVVDAAQRAGYATLGMHSESGLAVPAYHATQNTANPYENRLATEWSLFPGIFTEFSIPDLGALESIWPHTCLAEYEGTIYLHTVSHENRGDDTASKMNILYSRSEWDPATETMLVGDQEIVTEDGMNIACDVAVSYDGSRVALAQPVPVDPTLEELSQVDNNMYLWISEDGGETWNWDSPINLTDFIMPDPQFLPDDTLAADKDTLRCYTDVNAYFDHDNILHVAFTTPKFFHYENTITYTSIIFHWDEESDVFTEVANGEFWNRCLPGAWQRNVQRPSMYQDPESRILYCVYQQYGVEGDTTADGFPNDASDDSFANGEIMVTATPPNNLWGDWYGRMWAKGLNLTNTRGVGGGLLPGDCRNEREPSLSLNNDGDYLNISYVLDLDAGFTEQTEGDFTECPVIWHRVQKDIVMQGFNEQQAWVENQIFHVDSTQFWTDSQYDYTWDGGFFRIMGEENVDETMTLLPGEFSLNQNFPNPFNPSTQIMFNMDRVGYVKLAVYDLLGREIALLVDRQMGEGTHSINFHAGDLASGVYFYKLSSGSSEHVRKMILMK